MRLWTPDTKVLSVSLSILHSSLVLHIDLSRDALFSLLFHTLPRLYFLQSLSVSLYIFVGSSTIFPHFSRPSSSSPSFEGKEGKSIQL